MSVTGLIYLLIKLLVLGLVYYGLKWLIDYLGISVPDMVMKILAAILVLLGIVWTLMYLGIV